MGGRTSLTLAEGMTGMMENAFINVKNRSKTITAEIEVPEDRRQRHPHRPGRPLRRLVALRQGRRAGLRLQLPRPATHHVAGPPSSNPARPRSASTSPTTAAARQGRHRARCSSTARRSPKGRIERTQAGIFSADETADVGIDLGTRWSRPSAPSQVALHRPSRSQEGDRRGVRSPTFQTWAGWRSFLVNGDPKPGVDAVKQYTKIYPLAQACNPPPALTFVNMSGKPFNMVAPADESFWPMLHQVVQEEPTDTIDATTLGIWASIGIEKGKPFAPDARMKKILAEAAAVGDATGRALGYRTRDKEAYFFEDRQWLRPFIGGYKFEKQPGVPNLDAAVMFFALATGVTPAMDTQVVGQGSTYPWTAVDANRQPLDGGKTYKLRLPPNVPAKDFWSVIVYDTQTRSMLQTNQRFPSVSSQNKALQVNADGSVDVYFGPKAPAGKENNWVQTIPGKAWFTILRLYGPLEPWFNKTWRPDDIRPVK
jgi:hypothetical protein